MINEFRISSVVCPKDVKLCTTKAVAVRQIASKRPFSVFHARRDFGEKNVALLKPSETGDRVRELRQKKGWRLRDLAAKVGFGFTYLSRVGSERLNFGDYPSDALT